MRTYLRCALAGILACATLNSRAEDPLSLLFRQNTMAPIPDHRGDIAPGMLLFVNYEAGTYQFADLEDDARSMPVSSPFPSQFSKVTSYKVASGGAATKGLSVLLGFDPSIELKNTNSYTFSGVHFSMQKLTYQQIRKLATQPGPTLDSARAAYLTGGTDVFIVADVGWTDKVTMSSDSAFSIAAGTDVSQLPACTARPAANAAGDQSNKGGSGSPQAGSGSAAQTEDEKNNPPTTVDKLQDKNSATVKKSKSAGQEKGTGYGGSLHFCRARDKLSISPTTHQCLRSFTSIGSSS